MTTVPNHYRKSTSLFHIIIANCNKTQVSWGELLAIDFLSFYFCSVEPWQEK